MYDLCDFYRLTFNRWFLLLETVWVAEEPWRHLAWHPALVGGSLLCVQVPSEAACSFHSSRTCRAPPLPSFLPSLPSLLVFLDKGYSSSFPSLWDRQQKNAVVVRNEHACPGMHSVCTHCRGCRCARQPPKCRNCLFGGSHSFCTRALSY